MTDSRVKMFNELIASAEAHHAESNRIADRFDAAAAYANFYADMTKIAAMLGIKNTDDLVGYRTAVLDETRWREVKQWMQDYGKTAA